MSTMLATQNPARAAQLQQEGEDTLESHKQAARSIQEQDSAAEAAKMLAETGGLDEVSAGPVSQEGMPEIGDWIHYQPRRGEGRRGRYRVPALVIWRHPDTRLLDLVLVYDANDVGDQQRVPEAVGEERGWLLKPVPQLISNHAPREIAGLQRDLAKLGEMVSNLTSTVLGEFDPPQGSVLDLINTLDERLDAMVPPKKAKPAAKKAPAKKAKRGK